MFYGINSTSNAANVFLDNVTVFNAIPPVICGTVAVTANVSPGNSVCAGESITLTGSGATTYTWTDGVNTPLDGVSYIPGATATYTVTGTDGIGCTGTSSVAVIVNPLPSVNASASPASICLGDNSILSGTGANSYLWNPGGLSGSPSVSPAGSTIYTVTGTGANGCTNTNTVTVSVTNPPVVNATASPATTVCEGTSLTLSGSGAASYTWAGPVTVADATPFIALASATGIYTVTGISGPCVATSTISITVNSTPAPNPVTATPASICAGASSDLNAISTGNTIDWYLVPSGGSSIGTSASGANFNVIPANTTTYYAETQTTVVGPLINQTFNFTGSGQSFTVPAGVTSIYIETWGAQGTPGNPGGTGGFGGYASGNLAVTPGQVLSINVGGQNGFNGGGNAGAGGPNISGNGGGASDVRINGFTLAERVIIAAGGGGGTGNTQGSCAGGPPGNGGAGGPAVGATGSNGGGCGQGGIAGTGGNQINGGTGGNGNTNCVATAGPGSNGVLGNGGVGGVGIIGCSGFTGSGGGGGGGGYYGGGAGGGGAGGGGGAWAGGGGGGGSNYTDGVTSPTSTAGIVSGNGQVSLHYNSLVPGCPSMVRTPVTVTVNNLPTITANPAMQTICENAMATVAGGGGLSYTWTGGVIDNTAFVVTAPDTYTVTGTDANGCTNTATSMVMMNNAPVVSAGATPATTCNNTSVTPAGSGATSYTWTAPLVNGMPFIATANATYTVTGTDGVGCTGTSTVTVTVNPASGILAPATSNQSQSHGDDFDIDYYDGSCDLIATVDDGNGGNALGLTTSTVNVDATANFHNGQPFVRRWYQITPSSNGSADVVIYINQTDFDDYNSVVLPPYLMMPTSGNNGDPNIANIRITKNDDAGLGVNPIVITPAVNWNGNYWELSFNTLSFSQFRVHSVNPGNVPLPAMITDFSGKKLESTDALTWTTGSEQNNAYFNLQHSTDGINFATIAKVNSKALNGNSATSLNYNAINSHPALGHNYYRLQQVDIDNKASIHAKIVDLIWGANGSTVNIYPNPTRDILNIDLYTTKVQNTTVKVLDMSGRIIKQVQAKSVAGMNNITISLGEFASGLYTVQVYENDQLMQTGKVRKND